MKKFLLGLAFLFTVGVASAQKTDSIYVADSSLYIYSVDIGWADTVKQKTNIRFIFHPNSTVEIIDTAKSVTFIVDSIISTDKNETEDAVITVYKGHIEKTDAYLGVCMYKKKLFSVGIFNQEGAGYILFITDKPQMAYLKL